ncbi:hypothetical protein EPO15_06790 [bacterium]|nr:MAG: hypothetical protein EPO15_06790 [bacterium]
MLRDTLFLELELVRLEAGEQAAPTRRLDFSVRPLTYLLAASLAGELALLGLLSLPSDAGLGRLLTSYCGCGGYTYDPDPNPDPLARVVPDSTLLVRRLR